ncbi:hypothetical protein HN747_05375 [archaeon]|nr:hypothetical protein [archaeon]
MSTSVQTYTLGTVKQLIDLNGDTVNFDITFKATAKNGEQFDAIVVDQDTLDTTPDIEYKKADGSISGNIVSDKNVYQNYFLVVRADPPCECVVEISKREIQPAQPEVPRTQLPPTEHFSQPPPKPAKKGFNWKAILLVIVIVGGAALLWYMYKRPVAAMPAPVAAMPAPVPAPVAAVVEALAPAMASSPSPAGPALSLLDRLKNVPMK